MFFSANERLSLYSATSCLCPSLLVSSHPKDIWCVWFELGCQNFWGPSRQFQLERPLKHNSSAPNHKIQDGWLAQQKKLLELVLISTSVSFLSHWHTYMQTIQLISVDMLLQCLCAQNIIAFPSLAIVSSGANNGWPDWNWFHNLLYLSAAKSCYEVILSSDFRGKSNAPIFSLRVV